MKILLSECITDKAPEPYDLIDSTHAAGNLNIFWCLTRKICWSELKLKILKNQQQAWSSSHQQATSFVCSVYLFQVTRETLYGIKCISTSGCAVHTPTTQHQLCKSDFLTLLSCKEHEGRNANPLFGVSGNHTHLFTKTICKGKNKKQIHLLWKILLALWGGVSERGLQPSTQTQMTFYCLSGSECRWAGTTSSCSSVLCIYCAAKTNRLSVISAWVVKTSLNSFEPQRDLFKWIQCNTRSRSADPHCSGTVEFVHDVAVISIQRRANVTVNRSIQLQHVTSQMVLLSWSEYSIQQVCSLALANIDVEHAFL